jgi:signal transduction histidine kinase
MDDRLNGSTPNEPNGTGWSPSWNRADAATSPLVRAARAVAERAFTGTLGVRSLAELVDSVSTETGLGPALAAEETVTAALRDPVFHAAPPREAMRAILCLLAACTGALRVSLWKGGSEEGATSVWPGHASHLADEATAAFVLEAGDARDVPDDVVTGLIQQGARRDGVLLVRFAGTPPAEAPAFVSEAAVILGLLRGREETLQRNEDHERALVESTERRLVRLGFDLHDGPIQDLAALAGDIRLFREQLASVLSEDDRQWTVLGRVDDLLSRIYALDGELRGLVRSVETPTVPTRPFEDVLRDEAELFRSRADISLALAIDDADFSDLTASQRIALQRIVQEALSNIREHSGARSVNISVQRRGGYVHAEIRDDGCGFEVSETLTDAARRGRLGLLGMNERIRLLGGMFDIESAPGGPTRILVTLPEWRPETSRLHAHVEDDATANR